MHHIYHTEAVILGSRNHGEASKYFYLLTRDLGLVYATATGVRKMSSKLRFTLTDYSFIKVDLVRGKDIWRITSASPKNELESLVKDKSKLLVVHNITRLLKRLLAGEYPNQQLFEDLVSGLKVLEVADSKDISNLELLIVLRILNNLGYIGSALPLSQYVESPLEKELIYSISNSRREILKHINKALRETQL